VERCHDPDVEELLDQTADAAFVLDPLEDRFLAANPAACVLLGYTLEELRAVPISRIHPGELPQLQDVVRRVLRDGHGSTITLTCRTSSGQYLPTEMTLWAFCGDDGRPSVLALVRDRSDHRSATRGE
jgi:PAS domain S-box-containing protein